MLIRTAYKMKPPVSVRINHGYPLADKLIASYLMNEGSGRTAFDSSGRGHHGTFSGDVTRAVGKYGRALDFDGIDSAVRIVDHDDFDFSNLTVSVWVFFDSLPVTSYIFAKLEDTDSQVSYGLLIGNTGRIEFLLSYDGLDFERVYIAGAEAILVGRWYHIVVSYNEGVGTKFYTDGVLQGLNTVQTGALYKGTGRLTLGARYSSGPGSYKFSIDGILGSIIFWRRVLTDSDVIKLYVRHSRMFDQRARLQTCVAGSIR